MIEKWKRGLDMSGVCVCVWGGGGGGELLLTNLSKAFDCLPYPHHTVKFHSYGFGKASTEYLKDCLTLQKQNIRINKTFSNWINTVPEVPQHSVLYSLMSFVVISSCLHQTPA